MLGCCITRAPWVQLRVALQCKAAPSKQVMINIASIVMLTIMNVYDTTSSILPNAFMLGVQHALVLQTLG